MRSADVTYWLVLAAVLVGAVAVASWKAMSATDKARILGASGLPGIT